MTNANLSMDVLAFRAHANRAKPSQAVFNLECKAKPYVTLRRDLHSKELQHGEPGEYLDHGLPDRSMWYSSLIHRCVNINCSIVSSISRSEIQIFQWTILMLDRQEGGFGVETTVWSCERVLSTEDSRCSNDKPGNIPQIALWHCSSIFKEWEKHKYFGSKQWTNHVNHSSV